MALPHAVSVAQVPALPAPCFAICADPGQQPGGSSSLGAAVPTDWPTGRGRGGGVRLCRNCQRELTHVSGGVHLCRNCQRGLTHVPALSASRGSVATPDHRDPLRRTLLSHRRVRGHREREWGREGSSMGGKSGERALLEPSPLRPSLCSPGALTGEGPGAFGTRGCHWWWHR